MQFADVAWALKTQTAIHYFLLKHTLVRNATEKFEIVSFPSAKIPPVCRFIITFRKHIPAEVRVTKQQNRPGFRNRKPGRLVMLL